MGSLYVTLATKLPKLAPIEPDLHRQMLHNEKYKLRALHNYSVYAACGGLGPIRGHDTSTHRRVGVVVGSHTFQRSESFLESQNKDQPVLVRRNQLTIVLVAMSSRKSCVDRTPMLLPGEGLGWSVQKTSESFDLICYKKSKHTL